MSSHSYSMLSGALYTGGAIFMPKSSISYVLTRYERINMEIIKGNYSSAKIFTTNNAENAIDQ